MASDYSELRDILLSGDTSSVIPQSRAETILLSCINNAGIENLDPPMSVMEAYLQALVVKMAGGGSGNESSLEDRIVELERKIDALNAAVPYALAINDDSGTIDFTDRTDIL